MPLQDVTPEQHVPAWKKLGLKLKYAQEESEPITRYVPDTVNEKKRKFPSDTDAPPPFGSAKNQSKKTKVEALGSTVDSSNHDAPQPSPGETRSLPDEETPSRLSGTRKSVSFTPDTKTTDGDSVKQLYKTWLSSHLARDPSFDPSVANSALQVITSSSNLEQKSTPTTGKAKKPKGSKRLKNLQNSNGQRAGESPSLPHQATLDYLHTYYTSPSSWKFSKSRQTQLLRHLFSPGFVPPSYDLALKAYLSGLQGEGAKARLRTTAQKIQAVDSQVPDLGDHAEARMQGVEQEDDARKKQSHNINGLKKVSKANGKEEKKKPDGEVFAKTEVLDNKHPSTRRIADIVLSSIGIGTGTGTGTGTDDNDDKTPRSDPATKPNIPENSNPPETRANGNPTTTHSHSHHHPDPRQTKKRKRKYKSRTPVWDDDDDDSTSSSNSA